MDPVVDLGTPFLRFERQGPLAFCTIDRPQSRNALSGAMYYGVKKAVSHVNQLTRQGDACALIITGVGDVFAPGGELRGKVEDHDPRFDFIVPSDALPFEEIRHSIAPVVSAVNGICQGGGLLIAMLSDVAVASDRATFRAPELLRGIADTGYGSYLPPHIGVANARDLMLTARKIDAQEALRMGLIARVVPHDTVMEAAREAAEQILMTAPEARMHVKRIINDNYGKPDRMSMDWSVFRGAEAREGMQAFAEKRSPNWIPEALRSGKRL
ncbi:MAG TPA: enoyl-CoA hydratase/isomerase family protein [Myxococcota bacterium]|nr:enoyl-CoA hydratase/isomerase family protein [Myxococcota bacterium]